MKKIAVIGGGGTGKSIAADLTLAGLDVVLYEEPEYKASIQDVIDKKGIQITGALGEQFAEIKCVTTDIKMALDGAGLVLVATLATRHERIAELCAPNLQDGQIIIIGPGNAGSLVFHRILKNKATNKKVDICEIAGNYYSCRVIAPAKVLIALTKKPKPLACFPACNTSKCIERLSWLKGIYDYVPATNVLEAALSSPNIANHLAGSLLNTGAIEKSMGNYFFYQQGLTPSVLTCIKAVEKERKAIFKTLGYKIIGDDMLEKVMQPEKSPELENFRRLIGPTDMRHRYITEDSMIGQALMVSLGRMIKVPTPTASALLTLSSVINGTDYLNEGRTVEKLGLSGYGIKELNDYLFNAYV